MAEIDDLIEQACREQLEAGAAIRLLAAELREVLPLDDETALEAAKPVKAGRIEPDEKKIAARRDAIVRNATKQRVAVVILGGGHDLGDAIDRVGGADAKCGYVRVTTKGYPGD